jgi:hypothetical protein
VSFFFGNIIFVLSKLLRGRLETDVDVEDEC